ncbi:MAG TPA: Dabb family protein [bacterium]|nr:Dabb family protein [bacterium]
MTISPHLRGTSLRDAQASPVLRRVVLWRWNERATPEQRLRAKEGLAYVSYASPVHGIDFGEDIGLTDGNYDLVLLRDHGNRASWDEYTVDPHHYRVGGFIDTITHEEVTARADYLYKGQASVRGRVRHLGLYVWREGIDEPRKRDARRALAALRAECDAIYALEVADDLGWAKMGRADLVLEAHFADESGAAAFLAHPAYREAAELLAGFTRVDRTALIQHRMKTG